MENLRFCPQCGKENLIFENQNRLNCKDCDFTLYHNCAAAVAVLIRCGDEFFFTKRNQNPAKGMLDLSGGFVDANESAEEACQRELFEELSFEIKKEKLKFLATFPNVYHYKNIDYNTLDLFFEYEIDEKIDFKIEKSEISLGIWLKLEDLKLKDLAFDSQRKFLSKYKENFLN